MTQLLHFSLGPVQSFVKQARRTRDLWAGSFLLSWLAGQAMAEVRRQGGRIVFPVVANEGAVIDPLIAAIENAPLDNDKYPKIGSLPNRFKAEVSVNFKAEAVEQAVLTAWKKLAEVVWTQFVQPVADKGRETRAIWGRQINGFWEMAWVLDADPGGGSDARWLDARKNWRKRWPEPEGGDHCALMGNWQELSGFVRASDSSAQNAFWDALADRVGELELRDNERLCAIALVKRLFPRLDEQRLKQTIGWVPGANTEAVGNWPSTAYMAAIPWLRDFVGDEERIEQLCQYENRVIAAAGNAVRGERSTHIESLGPLEELAWLDGNFFLPAALANANDTPLAKNENARPSLCSELRTLQEEHPIQPYYALLLLDGDNLGKHLSTGEPGNISRALSNFSRKVDDCVHAHDGITLYAGGDDVMALLPYDRALDCAVSLRAAYREAFNDPAFTASVAIVIAHYHLPLRGVLAEGHRQLDDIAKEQNGRDSIAVAWFKASGCAAQWVAAWSDADDGKPVDDLRKLARAVGEDRYSSGFFYKLRTRYPMLDVRNTQSAGLPDVQPLLQAEYLKSREHKTTLAEVEQAIEALLHACRRVRRDANGKVVATSSDTLQFDALRLARLLAGKEANT